MAESPLMRAVPDCVCFGSSPVSGMYTAPSLQLEWAVQSISESSLLGESSITDTDWKEETPRTTLDKGHLLGKDSRFLRRQQEALNTRSWEMPSKIHCRQH